MALMPTLRSDLGWAAPPLLLLLTMAEACSVALPVRPPRVAREEQMRAPAMTREKHLSAALPNPLGWCGGQGAILSHWPRPARWSAGYPIPPAMAAPAPLAVPRALSEPLCTPWAMEVWLLTLSSDTGRAAPLSLRQ